MHHRFDNLRPRSAVLVVATTTALVVLGSAALAELLDGNDFDGFNEALWWSLQTVTTVGYGDVVPAEGRGRIIAGVVMLLGIAASAVLTAFVTSALFEAALRRHRGFDEHAIMERLDAIDARLSAIADRPPGDPG